MSWAAVMGRARLRILRETLPFEKSFCALDVEALPFPPVSC